ncbi:hypothetical protein [Alteromonas oceanisediminis]|uniref:hypothetical protein n=1 Tax=Alteromonas oceanisediminis TaxID=2836180 RepID=UPI001BD9E43E|nr:hypothetical protein [Alteromonas oceanisediminis]MBT0585403.1 hypothetical protein [Alteromonas oceanisediminis]
MKSTEQKLYDLKHETDRTRTVVAAVGDEKTAALLAQIVTMFDEAIGSHTAKKRVQSGPDADSKSDWG